MLDGVLFMFWGIDMQLVNCFWKIQVALRRAGFGVVRDNPLIWADSDSTGWTGWEVMTVHDE